MLLKTSTEDARSDIVFSLFLSEVDVIRAATNAYFHYKFEYFFYVLSTKKQKIALRTQDDVVQLVQN